MYAIWMFPPTIAECAQHAGARPTDDATAYEFVCNPLVKLWPAAPVLVGPDLFLFEFGVADGRGKGLCKPVG